MSLAYTDVSGRIKKQSYKMTNSNSKEAEDSDVQNGQRDSRRTSRVVHVMSPFEPPTSTEEPTQQELLWRKPEDKPIPLIWFMVFLIGLFLNVFSISVNASELCTTTACVIFYVVNGFGVVLDAAFLYFWWTKCLFYWKKWCALNQDWSIASCPVQAPPERPAEERSLRTLQISDIV
ncbi:hypothetical protein QZH41_015363 [Actinostola sp. cb2023]|nr:hypothetical protein QZH41_015363 [Actinostola sp. cb2023]